VQVDPAVSVMVRHVSGEGVGVGVGVGVSGGGVV